MQSNSLSARIACFEAIQVLSVSLPDLDVNRALAGRNLARQWCHLKSRRNKRLRTSSFPSRVGWRLARWPGDHRDGNRCGQSTSAQPQPALYTAAVLLLAPALVRDGRLHARDTAHRPTFQVTLQVISECGSARITIGGPLLQAARANALQLTRHIRVRQPDGGQGIRTHFLQCVENGIAAEGYLACQ